MGYIKYANDEPIMEMEYPRECATRIGETRKNKLELSLLTNEDAFKKLCKKWLQPCVDVINERGGEGWNLEKVFQTNLNDADEHMTEDFLNSLTSCVRGMFRYRGLQNGVAFDQNKVNKVKNEVEQRMAEAPKHLQLRVKTICILLSSEPQEIFVNGEKWAQDYAKPDTNEIDVRNNQKYDIQLRGVEKLHPKILYNRGAGPVTILIVDQEDPEGTMTFDVTIPGHGKLLALFADEAGTKLVNLKGSISVVKKDPTWMIVRSGDNVTFYDSDGNVQMIRDGLFIDIAPDGNGSFAVLTEKGIEFRSIRESLEKKPVRIYGYDSLWLWQYEDFRLEGNLRGLSDKGPGISVAVGTNGIMLWNGEKAMRYVNNVWRDESRSDYLMYMMGPFVSEYCEKMEGEEISLAVQKDGGCDAR